VRGLVGRVLHRRRAHAVDAIATVEPEPAEGLDLTRAWWMRTDVDMTPIEMDAAAAQSPAQRRVDELVRAHESGTARGNRPRGNPAFSEAVFVELMRAKQYRRAFDHLSSDCRKRWGSADAFAAAQDAALRWLQGMKVQDVRYLDEWIDDHTGMRYEGVAELSVEYTLGDGHMAKVVPRVVHLVADEGKWRSLCYPV
jgi:hypothetical protein